MGITCSCCSNAIRLREVEDVSRFDEAISFIETRLDAILIDKPQESTSGAEITTVSAGVASSIEYGSYFLENVVGRAKGHTCKIVKRNTDIQELVTDILKGAEQVQCVGAGVGVVAYLLDKISSNTNEFVDCVSFMCGVAKHIKQRINHLPQEKLNDVLVFIVKGSFFYLSRMQSTNLPSSFSALVDEEEIKILQFQSTNKYPELGLYPDEDDKQNAFDVSEDIMSNLDELMSYIPKCLATDKVEQSTSGVDGISLGRVASAINYGSQLLEKVLKRCKRHGFKSVEMRKVVIEIVKEASQVHWLAMRLSMVAFVPMLSKMKNDNCNGKVMRNEIFRGCL